FFEPALDYVVVKIPRWDIHKFRSADRRIGTEMKSVGEVMAIGRSFLEAIQKAARMLNLGATGLTDYPHPIEDVEGELAHATHQRLFALYQFFKQGGSVEEAHRRSQIDRWFLNHLEKIAQWEKKIKSSPLNAATLKETKKLGFSDKAIAKI